MELLVTLLILGLFGLWLSNRNLKARIDGLELRLDEAASPASVTIAPAPLDLPHPPAVPDVAAPPPLDEPAEPPLPPEPEAFPASDPAPVERESLGGLIERFVAGRLLIWVGGIALIAAAIFLIRYSIEIGLVTPELRMIAAALFGFLLLGLGEYARTGRLLADDPRIAQALVGAGLVTLYATAYGSHILYGLIGLATASAAMIAIAGAALFMSLRHGAPTAVMGLIGGFVTPLLVGSSDSGAVRLLAYLALLDVAVFLIAWRRGWTWLAAAAVGLSFVWSAALLARPAADALAAGIFILALALAAATVRPGRGRELGLMQPLAIGTVQLAMLVARTDLGFAAWLLFGALAAASMVLAALRPGYRLAPPLAVALALLLLLFKEAFGDEPLIAPAAAGMTLLFGAGGLALVLWRGGALWTAVAAAGLAGPALIVRAVRPELLERPGWGALMLGLAFGPAALAWLNRGRASPKAPADLALLAAGLAAALLLAAAVWDLLPNDLVAAGWLVSALLLGLAARRLDDLALATVAAGTAAVAVARCVWMVPELSVAAITGLVGDPVLATDLPGAIIAAFALALPALLLAGLRLALPPLPLGARRALAPIAILFAIAAAYVWFKQAFGLADIEDFVARGMMERTIVTQALFLLGWLLASGRVRPPRIEGDLVRLVGAWLTALAAARLIWFDLFLHNPAWTAQWVGPLPVANLILPVYLLAAMWLYLARRRAAGGASSGFWLAAFLSALTAGIMLMVRQGFQGALLTGGEMPLGEFYGYSLAGLVLSIALIVAGMRLPDKALRIAGLLLLTATIVKVFLVDASALEGIWRILSFLGLGIALIGIGRLYGPVLRAERPGAQE